MIGRPITGESSQDAVAAILGIARQNVSAGELRALAKLREGLADYEGEFFDSPAPIRSGRWNGRRMWRAGKAS